MFKRDIVTATGRLNRILTEQNNTQLLETGFTKRKTHNALTKIELQLSFSQTLIDKTYKQFWRQDSKQNTK